MSKKRQSNTIRLFVSSTFADMQVERTILQETVFPKIKEYCSTHKWHFEAIDLRWGISVEASLDQKTMQICISELKECQDSSPRPNFLILLGERYGWIPLPERIPYIHGQKIVQIANEKELTLFQEWYVLDTNHFPDGEYILQRRKGNYEDYNYYKEGVEIPLGSLFKKFAETLQDESERIIYERSATEQEIHEGALKVPDADQHVIAHLRTFKNLSANEKKNYRDTTKFRLQQLFSKNYNNKLDILKSKIKSHLSLDNVIENNCDFNSYLTDQYREYFASVMYNSILRIVDNEINAENQKDELEEEKNSHSKFTDSRIRCFEGREKELNQILEYLQSADNKPFQITGCSGSGKSTLLAETIRRVQQSADIDVVCRYLGTTINSSSGETVLNSIWNELDRLYPSDLICSYQNFAYRVQNIASNKPLIIVIDALDQLSLDDPFLQFIWMPITLPKDVYIIYSILDRPEYREITPMNGISELSIILSTIGIVDSKKIILSNLKFNNRKLTDLQWQYVSEIVEKAECTPMYLQLLANVVSKWHSYNGCIDLTYSAESMIFYIFDELSLPQNHGTKLVSLALPILSCCRVGVSHSEMREILASDDDYWQYLISHSEHKLEQLSDNARIIPTAIWSRLYNDLKDFLTNISLHNDVLIVFFHRQMKEAVVQYYLQDKIVLKEIHKLLINYFSPKWRKGDIHSMYELPYLLGQDKDMEVLKLLFEDLHFIDVKNKNNVTNELLADYQILFSLYNELGGSNIEMLKDELYEIRDFEIELTTDKVQRIHNEDKTQIIFNYALNYAATYKADHVINRLFKQQSNYSSMINILGRGTRKERLEIPLPIQFRGDMILSECGKKILSLNANKQLFVYDILLGREYILKETLNVKLYKVSYDFKTIIGVDNIGVFKYSIEDECLVYMVKDIDYEIIGVYISDDAKVVVTQTKQNKETKSNFVIIVYDGTTSYYNLSLDYSVIELSLDGEWLFLHKCTYTPNQIKEHEDSILYYKINNEGITYDNYGINTTTKSPRNFISSSTSRDSTILGWVAGDNIVIHNRENQSFTDNYFHHNALGGASTRIHLNSDGTELISIGRDNIIVFYDIERKTITSKIAQNWHMHFHTSGFHELSLASVLPNKCHTHLIYSYKGKRSLWQLSNLQKPTSSLLLAEIYKLSISADGKIIVYNTGNDASMFNTDDRCHVIDLHSNDSSTYDIKPLEYSFNQKGKFHYNTRATSSEITPDGLFVIFTVGYNCFVYNMQTKETRSYGFDTSHVHYAILDKNRNCMISGLTTSNHQINPNVKESYSRTIKIQNINNFDCRVINIDDNHYHFDYMQLSLNNRYLMIQDVNRNCYILDLIEDCVILYEQKRLILLNDNRSLFYGDKIQLKYSNISISSTINRTKNIIAISPSGKMYATYEPDGKILIYKCQELHRTINDFSDHIETLFTYDDDHIYIICKQCIYLYCISSNRIIDKFYCSSESRGDFHINIKLYSAGITIVSDSFESGIFMLEPSNGYKINQVAYVTVTQKWDLITKTKLDYTVDCPMCGKVFSPEPEIVKLIESITMTLDEKCDEHTSQYLCYKESVWDQEALNGECPHCRAKLKFNPFKA